MKYKRYIRHILIQIGVIIFIYAPCSAEECCSEEYAIYKSLLDAPKFLEIEDEKVFNIFYKTSFDPDLVDLLKGVEKDSLAEYLKNLSNSLGIGNMKIIDDLIKKNRTHCRLQSSLNLNRPYRVMKYGKAKYPFLTLSRVGFNTERNEAIVVLSIKYALGNQGTYFRLIKKDNKWTVESTVEAWTDN